MKMTKAQMVNVDRSGLAELFLSLRRFYLRGTSFWPPCYRKTA